MSRARNLNRVTTHRTTSTYIGDFSTARRNIIMASAAGPVDRGNAWDRVPAQTRARVDLASAGAAVLAVVVGAAAPSHGDVLMAEPAPTRAAVSSFVDHWPSLSDQRHQ